MLTSLAAYLFLLLVLSFDWISTCFVLKSMATGLPKIKKDKLFSSLFILIAGAEAVGDERTLEVFVRAFGGGGASGVLVGGLVGGLGDNVSFDT